MRTVNSDKWNVPSAAAAPSNETTTRLRCGTPAALSRAHLLVSHVVRLVTPRSGRAQPRPPNGDFGERVDARAVQWQRGSAPGRLTNDFTKTKAGSLARPSSQPPRRSRCSTAPPTSCPFCGTRVGCRARRKLRKSWHMHKTWRARGVSRLCSWRVLASSRASRRGRATRCESRVCVWLRRRLR